MSTLTDENTSTTDFEQPSIFSTRESEVRSYSRGWPAVFDRAEGSWLIDRDGNRLLDLLGGIAVNALGHAHPAWVRALSEQAAALGHISNFFTSPQQIELAKKLLELTGAPEGSRVATSVARSVSDNDDSKEFCACAAPSSGR